MIRKLFYSKIFKYAVELAKNAPPNEIPVSAIVAIDSKIISAATNKTFSSNRDWYHAEYLAVLQAMNYDNKYLENASIYVTLEPCVFCSALLEKVRIGTIYFGAYNFEKPALTECLSKLPYLKNNVEIIGGLYEKTCHTMLVDFFSKMRNDERNKIK